MVTSPLYSHVCEERRGPRQAARDGPSVFVKPHDASSGIESLLHDGKVEFLVLAHLLEKSY